MMKVRVPVMILCVMTAAAWSQSSDSKEMRTLKLRLKEAQLQLTTSEASLKKAEVALKEAQTLFEKGLYSKVELAQAEETYNKADLVREQAEINLEKERLAFLNDALHINLERAVLYRDADGYKHALLTIRNDSDIRKLIDENGMYTDIEKRALLAIENFTVRVLEENKLIGRPFEFKVPKLEYNQAKSLDFTLQKEVDAVTVELNYGATPVLLPVVLEKESKIDQVLVDATQFSIDGELGTSVKYDLQLERLADDNKSFTLNLLNLPPEYTYDFQEVGATNTAGSRISSVRFKPGVTSNTLQLNINMPREINKEELNNKITFFMLVLDRFAQQRLETLKKTLQGRAPSPDDLDSSKLTYEILELTPRGRAEVTIAATNLFIKVKMNEPIKFAFTLHNTGTVALERIRVYLSLPMDWSASINPEKDISLDVEAKKVVEVEAIPAADVVPGDYEIKIETKTMHEGRNVEAVYKQMRVQIEAKSNFLIGFILMVALVGMIVGVAVLTIKVSRR